MSAVAVDRRECDGEFVEFGINKVTEVIHQLYDCDEIPNELGHFLEGCQRNPLLMSATSIEQES